MLSKKEQERIKETIKKRMTKTTTHQHNWKHISTDIVNFKMCNVRVCRACGCIDRY